MSDGFPFRELQLKACGVLRRFFKVFPWAVPLATLQHRRDVTMDKRSQACALLDCMSDMSAKVVQSTGLSLYCPRPTDIIIATYPKAGTTLMQNLIYQVVVATGGSAAFDPDGTGFDDINQVAPWLDYGPEFGVMECPTNPRVFKTHSCADKFELDKSKFVVCVRNPLKYPGSFLDFWLEPVLREKITDEDVKREVFDEFVQRHLLGAQSSNVSSKKAFNRHGLWFNHVKDWIFPPRQNVLVLFYEDVVTNIGITAKKIARFMGRSLSDDAAKQVVARCDRQVMAADTKFQSHMTRKGLGIGDVELVFCPPEKRKGYTEFAFRQGHIDVVRMKMRETFGVDDYQTLRDLVQRRQDMVQ